ncbi:AtpG F0F1-type ATP synthase, gamma subunit [Sphingomonadaceae bacterium]|jgi:F-type H+-transporting ATPase subunit gamma|uniref:F0F1 ATP synthase subunit gamma n=2 Tax=Sphingorhabdus sp. TaxID=1902408 RepID=UPI002622A1F1|nr:F0F1 ATP synthase subunit gamma [Sphingorhabdus sp.]MCF8497930.1 F0F1 ATP synthase subunit gamma [Sphingomonadaceae bacterium]MCX7268628.1 F0F1 ATP synthase subunit gamma [Sphingomonadales bacterium]MDH4397992.1 F0F1 ATP synthase subunit gamma [Sphingorhabdus sp.]MDP4872949.1 F0F1 ATP synthase subunit gamma [Sphingorhabdus sp.]MDP4927969.1 F0F1 ATP synthase subunit gamma [Sphingorhabdus sp.]
MASLKALKMRINSVKSTQKITKAMKMVAAAKLRRATEAAQASRPYAERLEAVVSSIASKVTVGPQSPKLLAGTGKDNVHLLVVATSDKGLAGAFNTNIVRLARKKAEELRGAGKTVKFYTIGKKGKDQLARTYRNDIIHSIEPGDLGKLTFADVQGWGEDLTARFEASEFDVAHLLFSKFVSVLTQEPTAIQLMPVAVATDGTVPSVGASVEYEPDEEEILADLLPRNVSVQLLRANRENAASEQGSKMTAMDNATRNAGDMINRLTIQYNRTRQAAITTELIEIIAGAEAL